MPNRSKKPCSHPRCPKLVPGGQTYCDEHQKEESSRRNEQYDRYERDEKLSKFYSSARWQKVRKKQLKQQPLCESCLEEGRTEQADVVDHIVPVKVDWSLRLRLDNLQSLCRSHHQKKSAKDREKYDQL